jgi:hypothetical protein
MNTVNKLRDELGVAMVTVLLVGTGLTVVASTAAFVTIRDLRAGRDERRASEALSFAESGVERVVEALRAGGYTWGRLNRAGCSRPPIEVPKGVLGTNQTYLAYLVVYDAQEPDPAKRIPDLGSWSPGSTTWTPPSPTPAVCTKHEAAIPLGPKPGNAQYFAITSTGTHPTAARVVRMVVGIEGRGLPLGLFADSVNVQGGNPGAISISMITPGDVEGREKMEFTGYDPYYKIGDFWTGAPDTIAGRPAPAAIHALGEIRCSRQACGNDLVEHGDQKLNCTANRVSNGQSMWDQSRSGGSLAGFPKCSQWGGTPPGPPPYSNFTQDDYNRVAPGRISDQEYRALKESAQRSGLYCAISGGSNPTWNCTTPSGAYSTNGNIQSTPPGVAQNYVAYFDFPSSGGDPFGTKQTVTWKAETGPCTSGSDANRTVIVVARYGSVDLTGKGEMVGTFIAEEGQVWMRGQGGTIKITGSVIAKKIDIGGNAEATLTPCWLENAPTLFMTLSPHSWTEVDR